MKISVVAPLYKCAPYIEPLYRRCVDSILSIGGADYEIIFVNDGSPDEGVAIARRIATLDPNVVVVDLARNYGQHRAIMVGMENATGDLVFVMDADLEDEPEWIVRFHEEMARSGCDVVYGVQSRKKGGLAYRSGRHLFFLMMRLLTGATFPENTINARLMSRRYVNAVLQFRERAIYIDGIWEMCGFSQLPLKVARHDCSPSTYSLSRLLSLAINGVTSFSTRPLIGIAAIGMVVCLLAFAFTTFIVAQKLLYGIPVEGWPTIMAAILTIGGVTIFCNGIMAIYLAKIFVEVKQRPLATVKEIYRVRRPVEPLRQRTMGKPRQKKATVPEHDKDVATVRQASDRLEHESPAGLNT
jgi:putative glycosyltransferase